MGRKVMAVHATIHVPMAHHAVGLVAAVHHDGLG